MKRFLGTLSLLCMVALYVPQASAKGPLGCVDKAAPNEWPLYGHDRSNTRHQPNAGDISTSTAPLLAPVWAFSARDAGGRGDFTGTPVVSNGCVFVGSNQGWVFGIDADSGEKVWATDVSNHGTINSSLGVSGGRVFAFVSKVGEPSVIAFDREDGEVLWRTVVDDQAGADAFSSPTVFDGMVFVGISGDAAQHADEDERHQFHGSFVLLNEKSGDVIKKTWTIPESDWDEGFAGGTVTAVPAIDTESSLAYVGTGSSFKPQKEHERANAILKVDLDRKSETFGEILDSYKGDTFDTFIPPFSSVPCQDLPIPPPPPIVPIGRGVGACGDVDVDFAASPNLMEIDGKKIIGESQKSGAYHLVDAASMEGRARIAWGSPQPFGGTSTAYDGTSVFGAGAPPGYAFSLDPAAGALRWVAPIGDGAHYGHAMSSAGGAVFTVDLKGFIDAYDAATGVPLLHRPLLVGADTGTDTTFSFGGVSIARGTVFASVGVQSTGLDPTGDLNGYVIALQP
ncbi:MAG: hypothetical protein QOG04_905 [Actinomycetota bacterium]|jgi:polyvinyl alcohol dehydrogenase (cytochrome)|nr:hypothetical protein [Actinomycetota bacterium]